MIDFLLPKHPYTISILLLTCVFLNGCATTELWRGEEGIRATESQWAEAEQIYLSYSGEPERLRPKFCIPYRLQQDNKLKREKLSFPEITKGYILIKETDAYYPSMRGGSTLLDNQLELLFSSSIDLKTIYLYVVKIDKRKRWGLSIVFNLPLKEGFVENKENRLRFIRKLQEVPPIPIGGGTETVLPSDLIERIQEESAYYYPLCCYRAEAVFLKEFDTLKWKAILPQEELPVSLKFYLVEPERIYNNPLPVRIIVTPFSVAVDIITSPIQLVLFLTVPYWAHP
jgi:hypothetical protein